MRFHWRSVVSLAILVSVLASYGSADIVLNGDFEAGTGNNPDNWGEFSGPNGSVGRSDTDPFGGTFSGLIEFNNTSVGTPAAYFLEQNLGANTINPLLDHQLSFQAKVANTNVVGHDVFVDIQWLDQDGSNGGGVKGSNLQSLIALGIDTDYQQFTLENLAVPDDADSFLLRFQLSAGAVQDANNFNSLFVDNVVLTAIPEPSSFALIGLVSAGLTCAGRRRRK